MEIAALQSPPLTTIRSPIAAIGEAAAKQMLACLAGEDVPSKVEFEAELIVRASTGPIQRRTRPAKAS